jgi:hypothetical protein
MWRMYPPRRRSSWKPLSLPAAPFPVVDTRTRWALGVILAALAIAIVVAAVAGSA